MSHVQYRYAYNPSYLTEVIDGKLAKHPGLVPEMLLSIPDANYPV
ncbi:hypothetical protein RSAG8_05270, partial [Rhizoctonia solani AG-8 WAC10335]